MTGVCKIVLIGEEDGILRNSHKHDIYSVTTDIYSYQCIVGDPGAGSLGEMTEMCKWTKMDCGVTAWAKEARSRMDELTVQVMVSVSSRSDVSQTGKC